MTILQDLRRQKNSTQISVAKACGIPACVVSQWERRKKRISPERLKKLSEFFEIPGEDLVDEEGFAKGEHENKEILQRREKTPKVIYSIRLNSDISQKLETMRKEIREPLSLIVGEAILFYYEEWAGG